MYELPSIENFTTHHVALASLFAAGEVVHVSAKPKFQHVLKYNHLEQTSFLPPVLQFTLEQNVTIVSSCPSKTERSTQISLNVKYMQSMGRLARIVHVSNSQAIENVSTEPCQFVLVREIATGLASKSGVSSH